MKAAHPWRTYAAALAVLFAATACSSDDSVGPTSTATATPVTTVSTTAPSPPTAEELAASLLTVDDLEPGWKQNPTYPTYVWSSGVISEAMRDDISWELMLDMQLCGSLVGVFTEGLPRWQAQAVFSAAVDDSRQRVVIEMVGTGDPAALRAALDAIHDGLPRCWATSDEPAFTPIDGVVGESPNFGFTSYFVNPLGYSTFAVEYRLEGPVLMMLFRSEAFERTDACYVLPPVRASCDFTSDDVRRLATIAIERLST